MTHLSVRRGRGLALAFVLAAAGVCGLEAGARAQKPAIADLYAEPDLRPEAGALSLLLRSMLAPEKGEPLAWSALYAAFGGDGHGLLADPAQAKTSLKKLGASHLVTGTCASDGMRLVVTVRVTDARGDTTAVITARGTRGELVPLARELAARLVKYTGGAVHDDAVAAPGDLGPYVRAGRALENGDGNGAAAALAAADPEVGARVPAAASLARAVWGDAKLDPDVRVAAALQTAAPLDVLELLDQLGSKLPAPIAQAARARALARLGRTEEAQQALTAMGAGVEPYALVARAELAEVRGAKDARDAALEPAVDARYLPGLRLAAGLAPGACASGLEQKLMRAAQDIAPREPGLAARLALRAARGGQEPGLALSLIDADLLDVGQLADLATVIQTAPVALADGWRLRAEIRARGGAIDVALPDATRATELAPDDARAHRVRGRILGSLGQHKEAAAELALAAKAGDAQSRREQARALARSGETSHSGEILRELAYDAGSAESSRAVAAKLSAEGRPEAAIEVLEKARRAAPDDVPTLRALAVAYTAAGDQPAAARMTALADALEHGEVAIVNATPIELVEVKAETGGAKSPTLAGHTELAADSKATDKARAALLEPVADELYEILQGFAPLADGSGKVVLLVPRAGNKEAFWSPFQTDEARLHDGLEVALLRPPWSARLALGATPPPVEELSRGKLGALAADAHAELVLVYELHAGASGRATVGLLVYDTKTQEALSIKEGLDGRKLGLTHANRVFVFLLYGLGIAIALVVGFLVLRGFGELQVRIKLDPASADDVYCVRLSKDARPPAIPDPALWTKSVRDAGVKTGKREVTLVRAHTTLRRIPPGTWHVQLWGTYMKGGELRTLPQLDREVKIGRGRTEHVEFDLVPTTAEYRIAVYDGSHPGAGHKVWIDDQSDKALVTGSDGRVTLHVPRGSHQIRIIAGPMRIVRKVEVVSTKVFDLSINLERERVLQDNAGGIELGSADDADLGPIVTAAGVELGQTKKAPAAPPAVQSTRALAPGGTPAAPARSAAGSVAHGATAAAAAAAAPAAGTPVPRATPMAGTPAITPGAGAPTGLQRYKPVKELGRGAMGVVFRARDEVLERDVALKIISDEVVHIPQVLELFMQEGRALAALNHQNVVAVYDQGFDGERAFMVMEFVEGTTLEHMLEAAGGKLPLDQALPIIDQLCSGLAYAHARRVIHRDIKPANIFVSSEGVVKLGDFGLARVIRELRIHRTEVRGTPLYMAPEQIYGADIDFRADLYAVGCTLCELLTGRPPFIDGDVLYHHVHTPPPKPTVLNSELPQELDRLVLSCLTKTKEDRIASADAIRTALRPLKARYT